MNTATLRMTDFVGPIPGQNIVYVIVADRAKFDQIQRPATTHEPLPDGRRVLSKTIGNWPMSPEDGLVIFQHWLEATADEQKSDYT